MTDRRAPSMYMKLSADGTAAEENQLSTPRKAFMALCAALLLLSAPMLWASAAQAGGDTPSAVLTKDGDDDDSGPGGDDNSGPGGDDDDDDDDDAGANTRSHGDNTRGETDAGDKTGKTERR